MKKISFFLLLPILLGQSSAMFAAPAAVGRSTGPSTVAIGEPMGSAMQKVDALQRVPGGVLIFNNTEAPVSFSVGYETVSSTQGKINPNEKSYYTSGRAFISGVIDASGKFFPVKLYARDGSEIKDAIKYLKNRPGEMALGAVHYELTKENNQYVLREKQPGLPPVPQISDHDPKPIEPQIPTPDPAPIKN